MLYPIKRDIKNYSPRNTKDARMLIATKILSVSTAKRLKVEQGRFIKREWRIRSCKFQRNCK